jgi:hypothetical protein
VPIGVRRHACDASHLDHVAATADLLEQPLGAEPPVGDLLSAFAFDGLMMIALTPAEIIVRMSAIWPAVSVCRWAIRRSDTWPLFRAWALIEQIIPSRQPLPTSVLEMPSVYCFCVLVA